MKKYNREFVILEQDWKEFAFNGKPARGKCVVEWDLNKGKITLNVLNLKPEVIYKMYFVTEDKTNNAVFVSNIHVDKKGSCDLKREFISADFENSGISIDKFKVISIIVPKNNEIIAPLVGYLGDKILWKNNFSIFEKATEVTLEKEEVEETVIVEIEEAIIEEETIVEEETIIEEIVEEIIEIEEVEEIEKEVVENKACEENSQINELFSEKLKLKPFVNYNDDKEIVWVSISLGDLTCLKSSNWDLMEHPFLKSSYEIYNHLVIGKKEGEDRYVLGVPSVYDPELKGRLAMLGFKEFKSCEEKELAKGDYGYWLMSF